MHRTKIWQWRCTLHTFETQLIHTVEWLCIINLWIRLFYKNTLIIFPFYSVTGETKRPAFVQSHSMPPFDRISPLASPVLPKAKVKSVQNSKTNTPVASCNTSPFSSQRKVLPRSAVSTPSPSLRRHDFLFRQSAVSSGSSKRKPVNVDTSCPSNTEKIKISPLESPVQLHARLMRHMSAISLFSMGVTQKAADLPFTPGYLAVVWNVCLVPAMSCLVETGLSLPAVML